MAKAPGVPKDKKEVGTQGALPPSPPTPPGKPAKMSGKGKKGTGFSAWAKSKK
jgi:hypothetical protein